MNDRTNQILISVDNLLKVHDEWEADANAPVQPTAAFEQAINEAIVTGENGDIPSQCRDLCTALGRLGIEWEKFEKLGARTRDHRPIGAFWGAFRDVIHAREGATPKDPKQPEPVFLLVDQKVSHYQIANHIWGHHGKGPFLTALGQVDSAKIMEEARDPGKHTSGWVHPEQLQRVRDSQRELQRRLGNTSRREIADERTVEKATVVEMLKEGQYPDVIARVKGVSLEGVLDEARRYSIVPNVRPNLAAMRSPYDHQVLGVDDQSTVANSLDIGEDISTDELPELESDADLIRSLNDGSRGPAEIVAAAKEQGRAISYKQVKEALKTVKT